MCKYLFFLGLLPFMVQSQDVLKLKNGDVLNCKIEKVTDSTLVFTRNNVTKTIRQDDYTQIMYNKRVAIEKVRAPQDNSGSYVFADKYSKPIPPITDPNAKLHAASALNILGITFLAGACGLGYASLTLDKPQFDFYNPYQYPFEVDAYNGTKAMLNTSAAICAGTALACALIANQLTLTHIKKLNKHISLKQQGLGVGLTYSLR